MERATLEAMAIQLEAIRKSLKVPDVEIAALAETLPGYENLVSIKGIGEIEAAVLLSTIVNIENFTKSGHLAAFPGMTPGVSQSNDSLRVVRITRRGSEIARTTLVQCALVARRYSSYLHDFYEKIKPGRGAGEANIAIARKLLNKVFYGDISLRTVQTDVAVMKESRSGCLCVLNSLSSRSDFELLVFAIPLAVQTIIGRLALNVVSKISDGVESLPPTAFGIFRARLTLD